MANAWFAHNDVVEAFEFMTANQASHLIQMMSKVPGVSRSRFYAHVHRELCARDIADKELMKRIVQTHTTSKQTNGALLIHAALAFTRKLDPFQGIAPNQLIYLVAGEGLEPPTPRIMIPLL